MGVLFGVDNVEKGVEVGMYGLVFIIVFCLVYYKMFGVFVFIVLIVNMILIMGLMLLIGVILIMLGIVGIVFVVGMLVDVNVLIYECIKEELCNGCLV